MFRENFKLSCPGGVLVKQKCRLHSLQCQAIEKYNKTYFYKDFGNKSIPIQHFTIPQKCPFARLFSLLYELKPECKSACIACVGNIVIKQSLSVNGH